MARRAALLAGALLLAGCVAEEPPEVRTSGCPVCAGATVAGALPKGEIDECSGATTSAQHPGVLYLHNDSGDGPRFFALGPSNTVEGLFQLEGADAIDWEDVARGPCGAGGGTCLYFADIGDNDSERGSVAIYRVREPDTLGGASRTLAAERISVSYPDGAHDAETLLVHPVTGAITVVTKVKKGSSRVYDLPSPPASGAATFVMAGSLKPPLGSASFTSGDVHPDGSGVLLRTSSSVFYYPIAPDQTVSQALLDVPCEMPSGKEEQGESIAWIPGGWDYVTIGEGKQSPIHRVSCQAPEAP